MVDPPVTPKQEQATAHARGRICKVRGCEVCAPRREQRRAKKAERRAAARKRPAAPLAPTPDAPRIDEATDAPGTARRRQEEKHRAGLACGVETCASQLCVEGFARERARRHRARRPCKSADCANPICVASRA